MKNHMGSTNGCSAGISKTNGNCEPAILKSYFMCTFYLIKLPLCDIKITLDSEEKCKLFSWCAQQKKWPIQTLIEKREGKIV